MQQPISNRPVDRGILAQVSEGMRVIDSEGDDIGKVRSVYFGAVSEATNEQGRGPATTGRTEWDDNSFLDDLVEAFVGDNLPAEELRERLLRQGFIRIDTVGLFASDRYAMPDQIESVSGDVVRLRFKKDELVKQ